MPAIFAFGKHDVRKRFVLEGSRTFGVTYVYTNLLGNESGRAIYDGGALIASSGELVAAGPRFSYSDAVVTAVTVNPSLNRAARAKTFASRSDLSQQNPSTVVEYGYDWPDRGKLAPTQSLSYIRGRLDNIDGDIQNTARTVDASTKEDEFTRAISIGLFDYLRKSRSHGFVVSMSGGADSSAVACLIRTMAELSIADITLPGVCTKLAHIPDIDQVQDLRELMNRLFLGVYQATANSSEITFNAAQQVTEAVDGQFCGSMSILW